MAKISGRVINKKTDQGFPNLDIQLWDAEGRLERPLIYKLAR